MDLVKCCHIFYVELRSYDKLLTDFDEVTRDIESLEFLKDLVNRIDNGKMYIQNVFDIYTIVTKSITKWCDSTTPKIHELINGSDESKSRAKKTLSATTLDGDIHKIQALQQEITNSISGLDDVVGDIVSVLDRITADFDDKTNEFKEENRDFYKNLEVKFQNLEADIGDLKMKLKFEIQDMDDLRIRIENTKNVLASEVYPEFSEEILESVVGECKRYHEKHDMIDLVVLNGS